MKLKVSNVCQLLDKSKYPATITNSGVTFTNNGDGTITLNGTNTGGSGNLYSFMFVSVKAGHYYYIYSGQEGRWENCMFTVNYSISAINVKGNIGFQDKSFDNCVVYLYIGAGATFNNYIVKPQFFDLTEMYGAGHEPTTVEQFRQDFPNEIYDYSPECWKRLKELRYRTETKNLFDISKAGITQHNGYWTSNANYTEHFYTQIVEPGKTYTVSYECYNPLAGNDALSLGIQTGSGFGDGTALYVGSVGDAKYKWDKQYREFTIPNGITQVTLSAFTETMFRNLQFEEGSTATPYQPYGYLPLRRGEFIVNKEPVQLLDKSKYPATTTYAGVTFTNNGDGTITANGTTNEVYTEYVIQIPQFKEVKNDHKYVLFSGINDINFNLVECIFWLGRQDGSYFVTNCAETKFTYTVGFVIPQGEYPLYQRVALRVRRGYTANNLVFKPQLFDLTAMYGAGNEPTTVEQFRADYPNDLYEYNLLNAVSFH